MSSANPLPTQLATWMHWHVLAETNAEPEPPKFLYALKDTAAGDRQIVWEGGGGRGLIAVVDFSHHKLHDGTRWYAWGQTTMLDNPVLPDAIKADPVLAKRLTDTGAKALQGLPIRINAEEARAIERLAGGLPRSQPPTSDPRAGEALDRWLGRIGVDPEKTFELAVHTSRRLWKRMGFPEAPEIQTRLHSQNERTDIPDLLAPGVVGEVKRLVKPDDGPSQLERYIRRLDRERPEHAPWRGLLIQGHLHLAPASIDRIQEMKLACEVWAVVPGKIRRWKAVRLFKTSRPR